jgi:hypothetical protein
MRARGSKHSCPHARLFRSSSGSGGVRSGSSTTAPHRDVARPRTPLGARDCVSCAFHLPRRHSVMVMHGVLPPRQQAAFRAR